MQVALPHVSAYRPGLGSSWRKSSRVLKERYQGIHSFLSHNHLPLEEVACTRASFDFTAHAATPKTNGSGAVHPERSGAKSKGLLLTRPQAREQESSRLIPASSGGPKPPPPGVCMTKTSPGCISVSSLPASSSMVPSARSTVSRPRSPAWPPASPYGSGQAVACIRW